MAENVQVVLQGTTLDEPVSETLMRDLRRVGRKMLKVIQRSDDTQEELRNWDLWGPLILCLVLAITLSTGGGSYDTHEEEQNQSALVFGAVFFIVWVGSAAVTLNSALLGGNVSFFQCVCVLGYCIAPLTMGAIICMIFSLLPHSIFVFFVRLFVCVLGIVWSVSASSGFLTDVVPLGRRALALYPIALFYLTIGWIIMARSSG